MSIMRPSRRSSRSQWIRQMSVVEECDWESLGSGHSCRRIGTNFHGVLLLFYNAIGLIYGLNQQGLFSSEFGHLPPRETSFAPKRKCIASFMHSTLRA